MSQSQFRKFQCENIKLNGIWNEILAGITGIAQIVGDFFCL